MAEDGAVGQGGYADQAHPGCLRVLTRVEGARGGGAWELLGGDPPAGAEGPGCASGELQEPWGPLRVEVVGAQVRADFSPKGGPADVKGRWDGAGIAWGDGNRWDFLGGEARAGEPAPVHVELAASAGAENHRAWEGMPMWQFLLAACAVLVVSLPLQALRKRRARSPARF